MTLHILSGECLRDYLGEELTEKDFICFNECMADGEVTEEVFSERFLEVRAGEIAKYYGASREMYQQKTVDQVEVLKSKAYDKIVLWFDEDMFCQMNMLTLLAYMEQSKYEGEIEVRLVKDRYWKIEDKNDIILETRAVKVGDYFSKIYQKVLVEKTQVKIEEEYYKEAITQLPSLEQGIRLYEEYLKPANELTRFIEERYDWPEKKLVGELLERFREYGLGDIQYSNLINECKK